MKKRFIVLSSLITILLASFPMVVFADEVAQDSSNLHTISDGVLLDQYFYDNYDLVPYLQSSNISSGNQYIDTGIYGSSDLKVDITFSDINYINSQFGLNYLFGCKNNDNTGMLSLAYSNEYSQSNYYFYNTSYNQAYSNSPYTLNVVTFDRNECYFNNVLVHEFTLNEFVSSRTIYLFNSHTLDVGVGAQLSSSYKLYKFSIFDYSANNGDGAYVRYYYPAKAKTSGILGLYDAVSKTFVTTSGSVPFDNPTDDKVLNFQISDFVTSGLGWIDDIFDFVIETPIILFFFVVALAGSIYRWARRVVHF